MTTHARIQKTIQQNEVNLGELKTVLQDDTDDDLSKVMLKEHILKEEYDSDYGEMKSLSTINITGNGRELAGSATNETDDGSAVIKNEYILDWNSGRSNVCDREYITVFSGNDLIENISDEDFCIQNDDNAVDPLA